jgi:hypothetical protein
MANVSLPDWANFKMLIIVDKINYPKPPFLFTADKQKKTNILSCSPFFCKNIHIYLKKKEEIFLESFN